jgi:RNA polymerase sigma-70 factor (ECF subfamily)
MVAANCRLASDAKNLFQENARSSVYLKNSMSPAAPKPRVSADADSTFLERTFAEQRAPLVRYAAKLLGEPARAEDVVQDTFLRFLRQPVDEVRGHAVEWLFTVCRHRALDILRKDGRMKRFEEGQEDGMTSGEPRPGAMLEAAETRERLLVLIERLPPAQQEIVRLKFQNGFSYQEIARITEKSIGNVGFILHTAVARLRREFAVQQP